MPSRMFAELVARYRLSASDANGLIDELTTLRTHGTMTDEDVLKKFPAVYADVDRHRRERAQNLGDYAAAFKTMQRGAVSSSYAGCFKVRA